MINNSILLILLFLVSLASKALADPETSPYDTLRSIIGVFPEGRLADNKQLQDYLRSLLIRLYPEEEARINEADIVVLNWSEFRGEITYTKIRTTSAKRFKFHIAFSGTALRELMENEATLAAALCWVEGHEWRHSQHFRDYAGKIPGSESQDLELDADAESIRRMVKAGINPMPLLEFFKAPQGKKRLSYRSNFLKGTSSSHPNIELRYSNIQRVLASELEFTDPTTLESLKIPDNIIRIVAPKLKTPALAESQPNKPVDTAAEQPKKTRTTEEQREREEQNRYERNMTSLLIRPGDIEKNLNTLKGINLNKKLALLLIYALESLAKPLSEEVEAFQKEVEWHGYDAQLTEFINSTPKPTRSAWDEPRVAKASPLNTLDMDLLNRGLIAWLRLENLWLAIPFTNTSYQDLVYVSANSAEHLRLMKPLIAQLSDEGKSGYFQSETLDPLWVYKLQTTLLLNAMLQAMPKNHPLQGLWKDQSSQAALKHPAAKAVEGLLGLFSAYSTTAFADFDSEQKSLQDLSAYINSHLVSADTPKLTHQIELLNGLLTNLVSIQPKSEILSGTVSLLASFLYATIDELLTRAKNSNASAWDLLQNPHTNEALALLKAMEVYLEDLRRLNPRLYTLPTVRLGDVKQTAENLQEAAVYEIYKLNLPVSYEGWKKIAKAGVTHASEQMLERLIIPEIIRDKDHANRVMAEIFSENLTNNATLYHRYAHIFIDQHVWSLFKETSIYTDMRHTSKIKDAAASASVWYKKTFPDTAGSMIHDLFLDRIGQETKATIYQWKHIAALKNKHAKKSDSRELLIQIDVWKHRPPSLTSATKILASNNYWVRKDLVKPGHADDDSMIIDQSAANRATVALRRELGLANLVSPFYQYDLALSESLQQILWPVLCNAKCQQDTPQAFAVWLKLAAKGATEFTDHLFMDKIFPLLLAVAAKDAREHYLETVLFNQFVYDFDLRGKIWQEYYKYSEVNQQLSTAKAGKRDNDIASLRTKIDRYFPEASQTRANIVEAISNQILTNQKEADVFEKMKTPTSKDDMGFSARLLNGLVDAVKVAEDLDKIIFLKYLRGDELDQELTLQNFSRISIDRSILEIASTRDDITDPERHNLGYFVRSMGYERLQRFWHQLSKDVQAGIINPLLVGPSSLLSSPYGTRLFLDEAIPKKAGIDHNEAKATLLDYIDALKESGRGYAESYVQAYIFLRNKEGIQRSFGEFLKELFESSGPVGIALGQRLASLEVFAPEENAHLEDLKDRASPPSRRWTYGALGGAVDDLKSLILGESLLGSASIKVVAEATKHDEHGEPTGEPIAFAIFRDMVNAAIERDSKTLMIFLKKRIAANPSRYGYILPILENVIRKKRQEAHPEREIVSSQISSEIYAARADRAPSWSIVVIDVKATGSDRVLEMKKILAKRFAELSAAEVKDVSKAILDLHAPEALGSSAILNDLVMINPDIHSGNLLADPGKRILYLFDNSQMIGLPKQDLGTFYELLAIAASLRLDKDDETGRKQALKEALSTITGTEPSDDFLQNVKHYFEKNADLPLSGEQIIKDMLHIQRLAGNDGVLLSDGFQDWFHMIQNLFWHQRKAGETRFSDQLQEKVMQILMNHSPSTPPVVFRQQTCVELFEAKG